jgi:hypothetical protein
MKKTYYLVDEKLYNDADIAYDYIWDNLDALTSRNFVLDDDYEDEVISVWESDVEAIKLDDIIKWYEENYSKIQDTYAMSQETLIEFYCNVNEYRKEF